MMDKNLIVIIIKERKLNLKNNLTIILLAGKSPVSNSQFIFTIIITISMASDDTLL